MPARAVPSKTIQKIPGHSSIAVTSRLYLHRGEQLKREAADAWIGSSTIPNPNPKVRLEKALVHSGWESRPGAGSFRPVTIEPVAEVRKPLKPWVKKVAIATW
jgi:hypothetical protein